MGAYYCVEIRHELREAVMDSEAEKSHNNHNSCECHWAAVAPHAQVFASWKADGAVCLSPCDWVLAARLVEAECDNILSAKWTGEASFAEADRDRDGFLGETVLVRSCAVA